MHFTIIFCKFIEIYCLIKREASLLSSTKNTKKTKEAARIFIRVVRLFFKSIKGGGKIVRLDRDFLCCL
ncbi:hypothetical protein C1H71_09590 [Iodobacter fluviatilis]|uniref:Uncharacterized protein n=1 Tax=Iodobacter fluviatilis TaxID=537 RepID=A0A7G3G995_9NEIS|nr:hypothetical protein C1H71_09590 [Iodobacter fluviatilis]